MVDEYLLLKWGTLKGWKVETPESLSIIEAYIEDGSSYSAMAQHDTPNQKELICKLIDMIDGPITNDWTGKDMSKDEAKKYVMEYRS